MYVCVCVSQGQLQVPIRDAVIDRLEDKSSDVQVAATKFLTNNCGSLASDQLRYGQCGVCGCCSG
jgi:hypothetical protein